MGAEGRRSVERSVLNKALIDYYRCPDEFASFALADNLSAQPGYFRLGPDTICYGRRAMGKGTSIAADPSYDALDNVTIQEAMPSLPFDPAEVIDNLRCERYPVAAEGAGKRLATRSAIRNAYYLARPLMPVGVRKHFQRFELRDWGKVTFPAWPVDRTVD